MRIKRESQKLLSQENIKGKQTNKKRPRIGKLYMPMQGA
jgi:hypothetical protein